MLIFISGVGSRYKYSFLTRNIFFPYKAIKSLSRISLTQAGLEALFESNLLDDLKNVMKTNDVVRYRVYEVKLKAHFLMLSKL